MNRRRRSRACHEGTENGTGRPLNATSVCRVWNETREAKRGFILSMHAAARGSRERERADAQRRGERAVVRCVSQLACSKAGVCAKSDR